MRTLKHFYAQQRATRRPMSKVRVEFYPFNVQRDGAVRSASSGDGLVATLVVREPRIVVVPVP